MSLMIFIVGVLVFLITVYGTVVTGGLLLTSRQLEDQPELLGDDAALPDEAGSGLDRVRAVSKTEF